LVRSGRKLDIGIGLFLLLLPLLWFAPQVLGHQTLVPADNLYTTAPWSAFAGQLGATVPQNPLISDLILENYPWKSLLREALHTGQLPLWNPRLFGGVPFLAAGQHSALYPFSLIFYLIPLWQAYGIFTCLQLGLAALGVYVFARVLRQRRPAATLAAIVYAFSGFYIVSVNFTMVIAAAAWLPYILAVIELMVRSVERRASLRSVGINTASPLPILAVLGALLLGVQTLAGHVEITYYVLLVSAFYAAWRLVGAWRLLRASGRRESTGTGTWRPLVNLGAWLMAMTALGIALGAIQLVPLYELVRESFREGSASLAQVRGWAWPVRQIFTFVLPDVFGNPTHHSYFDIWNRVWVPVSQNYLGQPITNIDWGPKNYVEGGNYLGIISLLLALLAVICGISTWMQERRARRSLSLATPDQYGPSPASSDSPSDRPAYSQIAFFGVLAVLSLLFAFGTPLYAVLYYLLPGYKQLHSAFRWVFPYTLCMALLAGWGLNWLLMAWDGRIASEQSRLIRRIARILGGLALALGLITLGLVALSLPLPGPFIALGQRILDASDLARARAFASAAMAWSYEAMGLARFGLMATLAGGVLLWASRGKRAAAKEWQPGGMAAQAGSRIAPLWSYAAIALVILDLWLFGHGFNPSVDPKLLDFKPPVVQWLQDHQDPAQPWRLTSYEKPVAGEPKLLLPNAGMTYGLEDIRGYDSIIPRQYVAYMQRYQRQSELMYNRIAATYAPVEDQAGSPRLDDPLLNLLGVRYVLSLHPIQNPAYRLVYDGEVKVYENTRALPRAFIVPGAVAAQDQQAALDQLQKLDPGKSVVVEGTPAGDLPPAGSAQLAEARVSHRTLKEVFVDVNISDRGWLVLTENFAPGWKAYVRPFGAQGEGMAANGDTVEQQIPLYRADGTFRAVYLDQAGQWTIRFVYSPQSVLLGAYTSFLAFITLCLVAAAWVWRRYYRGESSEVGTVAKNSAVQMIMSLLNKVIDFAFAMLRLRILSPAGEGSFAFVINFYVVFEIITRFGLGTLLTRDVAQDRKQASRYLTNVISLRVFLWLASLPVVFLIGYYYSLRGRLTVEEAQAIAIFVLALFFANIADAISSVFIAYEKMEYPASLSTAMTVGKVALGGLVLLPPFNMGFVGLTLVSLLMNILQVVWLYVILRREILPDQPVWSGYSLRLQRKMLGESGPLMINNLLASVFWRFGVWILFDAAGAVAVGIFSAGLKYVDGLNVIPAYFTLAIFPLMSRYASTSKEGVVKAYRLALQLLLLIALPIAVFVTFAATPMIRILGGAAYLPDSATALSIMIWSIPIGFMNSVTQYALIAVGQQRFLTRAFIIGVVFTVTANVIFIPRYGYIAAAALMIPAELSLFIPFYWAVRRYVAPISWVSLCGIPFLAMALDAGVVYALTHLGFNLLLALASGAFMYLAALVIFGTFRSPDFAILWARFGWRLPWLAPAAPKEMP
jgi:O-antigen/teichoic acid export membrane protein